MTTLIKRYNRNFSIYQFHADLAKAFQCDCESFFTIFNTFKSPSFSTFTKVWKQTNFWAMFQGHNNVGILDKYLEDCFVIIKRFLDYDDGKVRMGALFMLYAVYYKQPVRGMVRVRLTQDDYRRAATASNVCDETLFVFNKMLLDGAFVFVAQPYVHGLTANYVKRYYFTNVEVFPETDNKSPALEQFQQFVKQINSDSLKTIENEYQQLMKQYIKRKPGLMVPFQSTIVEKLQDIFKEPICSDDNDDDDDDDDDDDNTSDNGTNDDDSGGKIRKIKKSTSSQ